MCTLYFQHYCRVSLYHTPLLRGALKALVPQRYNETLGLQHTKIFVFDDSVILSGANLSSDYFTNRQDRCKNELIHEIEIMTGLSRLMVISFRYVLVEDCPRLADYFDGLVSNISDFSLQVSPG